MVVVDAVLTERYSVVLITAIPDVPQVTGCLTTIALNIIALCPGRKQ